MADINELRQRLENVRQEVLNQLPDIAVSNTIVAKALVERNIREIGFGAKYSGNKLPAWFFLGKEKSNSGKAFIEKKKKEDESKATTKNGVTTYAEDAGMTWSDLRKAEGLPTDHVDLGFTNKMWAGLTPAAPYYANGVLMCPLAGNSAEVVDKLNWNRDRYGDFFGKVIGEKEIAALTAAAMGKINVILKENGF